MDKTALTGLRRCLRIRAPLRSHNLGLRPASRVYNSTSCAAQSTCSYSTPAINPPRSLPRSRAPCPSFTPLSHFRLYSSESPTATAGIVSTGAEGAAEETNRAADTLQAPDHLNEAEKKIWNLLSSELSPTKLQVQDISGGCGSMYGIEIVSEKFRGLSMLKQQRLVNKVLGEEIKGWHGVQLRTSVP